MLQKKVKFLLNLELMSALKQTDIYGSFFFVMFTASDLDSIRALFNEKEKELSLAVAKVEELTRQLEELRRGRQAGGGGGGGVGTAQQHSAAALELDKLRRELMVRGRREKKKIGKAKIVYQFHSYRGTNFFECTKYQ